MTDAPEAPARKRGRPRSAAATKAILTATRKLLERGSVRDLSIEAIARKAGVGKATVYRGWPGGKSALVLDVLLAAPELQTPVPTAKTHAQAVEGQLGKLLALMSAQSGLILGQLLAEGAGDAVAREAVEARFMGPLRGAMRASVEAGQKAGEFSGDLSPDLAADAICGAPFFRLVSTGRPLDATFCRDWPAAAIALLTTGTPHAAGRLL